VNKQKSQSGFAPIIIIVVILTVALIGSLGYIFWHNFIENKGNSSVVNKTSNSDSNSSSSSNANGKTGLESTVQYKTYTMDKYNLSFKYPSTWSLGEVVIPDSNYPYVNRSMNVKNENSEVMATLMFGVSGIGGTCDSAGPVYTNLDSDASSVKAEKTVTTDFLVVSQSADNGSDMYRAYYGLTDNYTKKGDINICLFYNLFSSGISNDNSKGTYSISFGNGVTAGNGKEFASLDDANKYIASDEYKEIKKMLLSLTY
jgi:hypothetical protein